MMLRRVRSSCTVRSRGPCSLCSTRCIGRAATVRCRRGPDLAQPMIWPLAAFRRPVARGESAALSMHELTALMLLQRSPERCELDRADLESLAMRKLVAFEALPGGKRRPRITEHGADWLAMVTRSR